jgi:hypothetical protein
MALGERITSRDPVSQRLLSQTGRIQNHIHSFDTAPVIIGIDAPADCREPSNSARGVGCMFSGGADSFYSVLRHLDEITHLIFVHGFDVPLSDTSRRQTVSRSLQAAAAELGKPLIEIETNLREFSDPFAEWGRLYHGSALASIAQLLSPIIGKCYIPSTQFYCEPHGWGSNPTTDPLWSTEEVEIVHDDQVDRSKKIVEICKNETVRRYLRVCHENRDSLYNCGSCAKCLRTMVALRATGALREFATFRHNVDLFALARLPLFEEHDRLYTLDNLQLVRQFGGDPRLERALEDSLNGRYYRGFWRAGRRIWWALKAAR